MTSNLITPITCPRCKGYGIVNFSKVVVAGVSGRCLECMGERVVEGDPAQVAANRAARLTKEARDWAVRCFFTDTTPKVRAAFSKLQREDRPRSEKCKDAIAAGDPRVAAALLAYGAS